MKSYYDIRRSLKKIINSFGSFVLLMIPKEYRNDIFDIEDSSNIDVAICFQPIQKNFGISILY